MADPVNLADVLFRAYGGADGDPYRTTWGVIADAVLAYGGGDPVVVMPDGTLLLLTGLLLDGKPRHVLTEPVVTDAWTPDPDLTRRVEDAT